MIDLSAVLRASWLRVLLLACVLIGVAHAMDLSVDNEVTLDGKKLPWPASIDDVQKILGPPDRVAEMMNRVLTWDKLGVTVYTEDAKSDKVEEICLQLAKEPYPFSPRESWSGKSLAFGVEATNKAGDGVFEKANFTRKGSARFYKFFKLQNGFRVTVDSVRNDLGWTRLSISPAE